MKKKSLRITLSAAALFGVALGIGRATWTWKEDALRPLPKEPQASPIELLHAQPFVLDDPYEHTWRSEGPLTRSGYVLVLEAEAALVRPRQTLEPVLYVGAQTAERVNAPRPSGTNGRLVVLVPAPLDADGNVALNPRSTPIWFGTPELPERVDAHVIQVELGLAQAAGAGPARLSKKLKAHSTTTGTLYARDRAELEVHLSDLIELYSPEEVELIEGLRLPVNR